MKTLIYSVARKELTFEDDKIVEIPPGFLQQYESAIVANINLRSCLVLHIRDFYYFNSLTKLYLIAPSIQQMNRFTLVNLTSLIHLHLEVVRIVHLPRFFIFNLINLRKVAIIVNQTTFVNHTIFVNNLNLREITITYLSSYFDTINLLPLIHLSILKITGAQLQIGELTLINCYYLKRLLNLKVLTFEKIHCFDLRLHVNLEQFEFIECYISEPDFVNELRSLTYLEIRDCNLNLEYNRLILNLKLKNIVFANNVISVLLENDFNNFQDLMYLDLSDCQIAEIQNYFLGRASKSINVIKLNSNRLISLRSNVFHDCKRLFSLDLSNNHVVILFKHVFDALSELVTLDLQNNKLSELPTKIFCNLNSLKCLNLSSNHLQQVPANWFNLKDYYVLESLDLSSNLIYFCDPNCFKMLTNMKRLNLSHNRLTFLSNHLFDNLELLTDLNLGYNRIHVLKSKVFMGLKYLETLKLSSNCINFIESETFNYLSRLRFLNLNRNYLVELTEKFFENNGQLRILYLNNNCLSFVVLKIVYNLYNLEVLRLDNNRLRTLCWTSFKNNGNLHSLHVDGYLKVSLSGKLPNIRIISNA